MKQCEGCRRLSEEAADRIEIQRLRNLIGELYVARGGSRIELYAAIKRAFREATRADALSDEGHDEEETAGA